MNGREREGGSREVRRNQKIKLKNTHYFEKKKKSQSLLSTTFQSLTICHLETLKDKKEEMRALKVCLFS